ncbi:MAG: hypothetical protein AVDCRST_MAG30-1478, partial [uncultured Solirubrobacteraceae bacterium]
ARQDVPPQGLVDLARAAVGPQRRRHGRPHPAAGQDHRGGAAADRPRGGVRRGPRRRRGLRPPRPRHAGDPRRALGRAAAAADRM